MTTMTTMTTYAIRRKSRWQAITVDPDRNQVTTPAADDAVGTYFYQPHGYAAMRAASREPHAATYPTLKALREDFSEAERWSALDRS